MTEHAVEVEVVNPAVDPLGMLSARPTNWFRRFLILAVHGATVAASRRGKAPWFRLGPDAAPGPGRSVAPLIWWPHVGDATFRTFRGEVHVDRDGHRVRLAVLGHADGGDAAGNEAVLRELLRLLASAIGASQPVDG